jgi:hypothetical protein
MDEAKEEVASAQGDNQTIDHLRPSGRLGLLCLVLFVSACVFSEVSFLPNTLITLVIWPYAIYLIVKRKRYWAPGFVVKCSIAAMAFSGVLTAASAVALGLVIENDRGYVCRTHLKQIALAVAQYQDSHQQTYPPSLQTLVDTGIVKDISIFQCPATRRIRLDVHSINATSDYEYHPLKPAQKLPEQVLTRIPMVWEKEMHGRTGGMNTAFADALISFEDYEGLVRKINAAEAWYADGPVNQPPHAERE